jgi:hypothetical protein
MTMIPAMGSALTGIRQSFDQLDRAASRVAAPTDDVDAITESVIESTQAKNGVKMNTRVLQVGDEMLGTMLDMIV